MGPRCSTKAATSIATDSSTTPSASASHAQPRERPGHVDQRSAEDTPTPFEPPLATLLLVNSNHNRKTRPTGSKEGSWYPDLRSTPSWMVDVRDQGTRCMPPTRPPESARRVRHVRWPAAKSDGAGCHNRNPQVFWSSHVTETFRGLPACVGMWLAGTRGPSSETTPQCIGLTWPRLELWLGR